MESFGQNNLSIELEDVDDIIIDKNLNEKRIDNKKIYLLGHSRSGGISILLQLAVNSNIQKLILWGSLSDLRKKNH